MRETRTFLVADYIGTDVRIIWFNEGRQRTGFRWFHVFAVDEGAIPITAYSIRRIALHRETTLAAQIT